MAKWDVEPVRATNRGWWSTASPQTKAISVIVPLALIASVSLMAFISGIKDGRVAACEARIMARLKAPDSAQMGEATWSDDGPDSSTVHGAFKAKNPFGVLMRDRYTCQVDRKGGEWTVSSLSIDN